MVKPESLVNVSELAKLLDQAQHAVISDTEGVRISFLSGGPPYERVIAGTSQVLGGKILALVIGRLRNELRNLGCEDNMKPENLHKAAELYKRLARVRAFMANEGGVIAGRFLASRNGSTDVDIALSPEETRLFVMQIEGQLVTLLQEYGVEISVM